MPESENKTASLENGFLPPKHPVFDFLRDGGFLSWGRYYKAPLCSVMLNNAKDLDAKVVIQWLLTRRLFTEKYFEKYLQI